MGDGGAGRQAKKARLEEEARQNRIRQGTIKTRSQFSAFDDKYYADKLKEFQNAYNPDVEDKYKVAYGQMQNALLRSGLFANERVSAQKEKEASKAKADALDQVTTSGLQAEQQRKNDLAFAENTVLSQLANTGDATAAFNSASARIREQNTPYVTPMLGQIFQDLSAGLSTQADLERNNQNRYNVLGRIPGWSNPNRYTRNVGS